MSDTKNSGFFIAYFSAEFGTSIGVFQITEDSIIGADLGGGIYNGTYAIEDGRAKGIVNFSTRAAGTTITGSHSDLPISYDTEIDFQLPIDGQLYHEIQSPAGPVNVRFEKVREI